MRLSVGKDGQVKFTQDGRPIIRVDKRISEQVALVRENFVANLQAYAHDVATSQPEAYRAQIDANVRDGTPIRVADSQMLDRAITANLEAAIREAEAKASETAPTATAPIATEPVMETEPVAETETLTAESRGKGKSKRERELVPA